MGRIRSIVVFALLVLAAAGGESQLSGTYTIDPSKPTGGRNYRTFGEAIAALELSGVSSAVTFEVASSTYAESIAIGPISGASFATRVTFAATGAPAVITPAPTNQGYGIHLEPRTNWLNFHNFKIGGYLRAGILLDSNQGKDVGPSYNVFSGIEVDNGPTLWPSIRAIQGERTDLNEFRDCVFRASGTVVDLAGNQNLIERCEIDGKGVAARLMDVRGIGYTPTHNVVQNCFLHGVGGGAPCQGLAADAAVMYFHNTVLVKSDGPCVAAGATPSTGWPFAALLRNNILVNLGAGPVLRYELNQGLLPACDSAANCLHAPGSSRPVQVGPDTAPEFAGSLAAFRLWQQANSGRIPTGGATGYEVSSIQADPGLVSLVPPYDIHLKSTSAAIDRGTTDLIPRYVVFRPWSVSDDFERQARVAPVDIGADEVSSSIRFTGTGGIGTTMELGLTAQHEGGLQYQLASSLGVGPIHLGNRQLRLSPDVIFLLSVGGLTPQIFDRYFGFLDPAGSATARIRIPSLSSLKGVLLHNAFVTLRPAVPIQIQTISLTYSFRIQ